VIGKADMLLVVVLATKVRQKKRKKIGRKRRKKLGGKRLIFSSFDLRFLNAQS
jgi:hypothetical protein